jgi:hypothetical protein
VLVKGEQKQWVDRSLPVYQTQTIAMIKDRKSLESKMLEIHQRYVLDDTGIPIAVQIPIAQFETLLGMLDDREQVSVVMEDGDWTVEELRKEVAIGLKALEDGRYTDYDAAGLESFFEGIKRKGRLQRGIEA